MFVIGKSFSDCKVPCLYITADLSVGNMVKVKGHVTKSLTFAVAESTAVKQFDSQLVYFAIGTDRW